MSAKTRRIVVVGGGIAGLAAAWSASRGAARGAHPVDVVVLERGDDVGGAARTIERDGWLVECGPSSYLPGNGAVETLAAAAGITDEIVPATSEARRRLLFVGGRLREVTASPVSLVRSGLLSVRGGARLCLEPLVPRRRDAADESIHSFVARRFGREAAHRLALPAMLGIFAGDARQLSAEAAFPRWVHLEREHGSLLLGRFTERRAMPDRSVLPRATAFRHGMQSLPRALARVNAFDVRCGVDVTSLRREDAHWRLTLRNGDPVLADAVILAGDALTSARLLDGHAPAAATALRGIERPGIAIVALGYGPADAARLPRAFGALIARGEGYRMLGALCESRLFPHRAPEGHALLRILFGGATDTTAATLPDAELLAIARSEVGRLFELDGAPVFSHVVRIPHAIPQYALGHPARVARIERAVASLPRVAITGFALRGVSFAEGAADGIREGERILATLVAR